MTKFLKWSAPIVVAALCSLSSVVFAKSEWKQVQSTGKDFSILMPADAKSMDQRVKNITIKAFTASEDGTNYSITHAPGIQSSPGAIDSIGEGAISEFKKQAQALGVDFKIDKTEEAKGDGWTGKKTFLSIGPAKLQMIAALSENKNVGFCLIAASQAGAAQDPEFFNSFKVDTKRTNELYPNNSKSIGEIIGRILGIVAGGGLAFFIAHKIKQKNKSAS